MSKSAWIHIIFGNACSTLGLWLESIGGSEFFLILIPYLGPLVHSGIILATEHERDLYSGSWWIYFGIFESGLVFYFRPQNFQSVQLFILHSFIGYKMCLHNHFNSIFIIMALCVRNIMYHVKLYTILYPRKNKHLVFFKVEDVNVLVLLLCYG